MFWLRMDAGRIGSQHTNGSGSSTLYDEVMGGNIKSIVLPFNNDINYSAWSRSQTIIFMQSNRKLLPTESHLWHLWLILGALKPQQHPEHFLDIVAPYSQNKALQTRSVHVFTSARLYVAQYRR